MENQGYYSPKDLKEACALLSRFGGKAKILAGGTDLMAAINRKRIAPEVLIHIGNIGLDTITAKGKSLIIGASVTHAAAAQAPLVTANAPLLAKACKCVGSPAIRNVGTIGGNICNASPAADAATALVALGAEVKLVSATGERNVALDAFFTGPGQTVMAPDELLKEIIVPKQNGTSRWGWEKLGQRKADVCGAISVAVSLRLEGGKCCCPRIALGAVAPKPLLAVKSCAILNDQTLSEAVIADAARTAADETAPIDDVRGTAWYRKRAGEALVKRILSQITV